MYPAPWFPFVSSFLGALAAVPPGGYAPPPSYAPPAYVAPGYDPGQVRFVQQAMNFLMAANLQVDGVWGQATASAVATWQHNNGLPATGRFDLGTLAMITRTIGNTPMPAAPPRADVPPPPATK